MADEVMPLTGINVQLALARRNAGLSRMDDENTKLRGSGFNLDAAVGPAWDRAVWEQYKATFGEYPFGPGHKPPGVLDAPLWVKKICGITLNPAERMGYAGS